MITEYKVHLENKTKDELVAFILQLQKQIDEKDKEINRKSSTIKALQCALHERTEERDRKDYIIARQKKQIDLMAEELEGVPINKNISNFEQPNLKECITIFTNKEDVKQYYESKATNDG